MSILEPSSLLGGAAAAYYGASALHDRTLQTYRLWPSSMDALNPEDGST